MQLQKINQQESFGRIRRLPTQREMEQIPFNNKSGIQAINGIKPNMDLFEKLTTDSLIDLRILAPNKNEGSVATLKISSVPRSVNGTLVEEELPLYAIDNTLGLLRLLMQINDKTKAKQ